jgi:hypothetical protein
MKNLHDRMDKAVMKISKLENKFESTKGDMMNLGDYLNHDDFNADTHEKRI